MLAHDSSHGWQAPFDWLSPLAWGAWLAAVLQRSVIPGLHGSGVLSDRWVGHIDLMGGLVSQLVVVGMLALLLDRAFATLRAVGLSLVFRLTFTTLVGLCFGFAAPAVASPLPSRLALLLAHATVLMALLAAGQTFAHRATRLPGFLLAGMGLASLTRLVGWFLALSISDPRIRLAFAPMVTAAWVVKAIAIFGLFFWLARQRRIARFAWLGPLLMAIVVAAWSSHFVSRPSVIDTAWGTFWSRALVLWTDPFFSLVPLSLRLFFAVLVPLLVVVTLLLPRSASTVGSRCLALMLLGGMDADVPFFALCTTLASVGLVLQPHRHASALLAETL